MFERFTERTRHVMVLAQDEARLLHHDHIGTEHLLLGLVRDDGTTADVLAGHGVTLDALHAKVEAGTAEIAGPGPFTPRAKQALEGAFRESLVLKHDFIGPEHLLLAILRVGEGGAAGLLTDLGVNTQELRAEVLTVLEPGAAPPRRLRLPRRQRAAVIALPSTPPPEGAVCPSCGAELADHLSHSTLEAAGDAPLPVVVVWCAACGTAIGVLGAG